MRKSGGVIVAARTASAHAWEEGFQPGDVIHALNGEPVTTLAALRTAAAALKSGDATVAQIERRGRLLYVAFELE
ncbi:MAG: PDZ domain-containing protein [bacterium]